MPNSTERTLPSGARVSVVSRCSWTLYNFRRALLHRIVAAGGQVVALGGCGDGFDRRLREEGIDVRHVPVSRAGINPAADLHLLFVLIHMFRKMQPQIVHAFTVKPSVYATIAAAVAGVPVRVVTITGLGHAFTTAPRLVRFVVAFLYRTALSRADVVFFQNREDRDLFVARGLVDVHVTRLTAGSGVDLARFAPQPLPSQGGKRPGFLMISRLLKEKGVREYLAAAERLKAKYPDVEFRLLGGTDSRNPSSLTGAEVDALRRSTSVEWIDEVDDVRPFIRDADVVLLPSYREGLPRSLLEAAAMGRALVATNVPGCRDVVQDQYNGLLVPVANVDSLAQAMERLIERPEDVAVFGGRARKRAEEQFDERVVIEQTLAAYAEVLNRKTQAKPSARTAS